MPNKIKILGYDKFYHIYNRGINGCRIFEKDENYTYFLKLYEKYIPLVAETYGWVLMGNHFHLLIRIKGEDEILTGQCQEGLSEIQGLKRIYQQFSNLFNAYTKAFNKSCNRTGSLFEHPFRRKEIKSDNYLKHLIYYIHNNPVHHNIVTEMIHYKWSSYNTIVSNGKTKLQRDEVLNWFDDIENFTFFHKQQYETELLKGLEDF